jgi:hypothetical protein
MWIPEWRTSVMVMENREFEDEQILRRDRGRATLLAAEAMRTAATPLTATRCGAVDFAGEAAGAAPPAGEKISLFWQVFGGTIVSVFALIIITAFGQLSSTATDLRRDVNQLQAELVRKDEMNARLNALWQSVKDLQATTASRASLQESTRVVNQDLGARIKTDDERRKDLQRQVEELNRRVQTLAERLASIETAYHLTDLSGATGK